MGEALLTRTPSWDCSPLPPARRRALTSPPARPAPAHLPSRVAPGAAREHVRARLRQRLETGRRGARGGAI